LEKEKQMAKKIFEEEFKKDKKGNLSYKET